LRPDEPDCKRARRFVARHRRFLSRAAHGWSALAPSFSYSSFAWRSLKALAMTQTELKLMAALDSIGLSRIPHHG
jgi:hypothetical protein